MIDILLELHKYVPVKVQERVDEITNQAVSDDKLHPLLIIGDMLTRKRIESAKELRKNSVTPATQLKGLIPACADWHAKKTFLEVP
jgi:hypothetical protein